MNCWEDYSRFKTLYRLIDGIQQTATIHRQSTPTDHLLERLREYDGPPYVVILDEVDQLEDKSLLYDLYRIRNLSLILIANSEQDLFSGVGERLNSRLTNSARIHFRAYHDHELLDILQDRVHWGLEPDTIDDSALNVIARNAAGDARVAIGILRRAARQARDQNADRVTEDMIRKVTPEAKSEIEQKAIDQLKPHQEILYRIIAEHDEIQPEPLYDAYCDRTEDPNSHRMVRNYLSKLEHYNLIVAEGNTKARRYRPVP